MSDLDATTPRVFIARHGETEWTKTGRYTGTTDLDLTPYGMEQTAGTAAQLVGRNKLIDPDRIHHIWVSPRKRARQTFNCLFDAGNPKSGIYIDPEKVTLTEDLAEWNYGDYEGLLVGEIHQKRKKDGLDKDREWNIWRDGCTGGESAQQVTTRLDKLVSEIQALQRPYMNGQKPVDVMLVGHGLILRCFMKRWLKFPLDAPLPVMFSPGAIGILGYKNHNADEPAFFLGMALPSQR